MTDDQRPFVAYYILGGKDDHEPIETDVCSWAQWFDNIGDRRVAHDEVGDVRISTVFLGLNHNFASMLGGDERPHLFETMTFKGDNAIDQWRCATWDEAVEKHKRAVYEVVALTDQ